MTALVLMRWAVLGLALYNAAWAAPAALRIFRLQLDVRIATHLVFLLASVSFVIFQATYFWTGGSTNPGWSAPGRTLGLALQFFACAVMAWLGGQYRLYRGFASVFSHPGEALAMSDLARVDPQAAEQMADQCRRLTAKAIIGG